ncbi:LysR family transcriptional regulator [Roseateles albus]|uniref:LysR family transcriptional regulator n=1 Tax=Roseateles albus TaxID=2987525 RepID=A0ABT5KE35_9BURK|nr:LysR family transcriptional regulator [Roseateles albus]MDC8771799.1 LysR family transcriptional regulator [Roseateles albus]
MNPLERLQIFHRVAELSSFTQAALSLSLPKASASSAVQQLESQLGARLLHRTTRRVQLTQDGQAFYERSKDVLADMEELQAMFAQQPGAMGLSGRVRVDMSSSIARDLVIPRLPELLQAHPLLSLEISSTERRVDLVREGFDCVLRVGSVVDTSLIARPLGLMRMLNCASPAYLARHGVPASLADLTDPRQDHRLVHFVNTLGAKPGGFDYLDERGQPRSLALPGAITVNNADAYQAACLAGLGLIQVPVLGERDALLRNALRSGTLVAVLPKLTAPPMPINLLYANRRNLSRRVRVVMDWLAAVIAEAQLATND